MNEYTTGKTVSSSRRPFSSCKCTSQLEIDKLRLGLIKYLRNSIHPSWFEHKTGNLRVLWCNAFLTYSVQKTSDVSRSRIEWFQSDFVKAVYLVASFGVSIPRTTIDLLKASRTELYPPPSWCRVTVNCKLSGNRVHAMHGSPVVLFAPAMYHLIPVQCRQNLSVFKPPMSLSLSLSQFL